MSDSKKRGREEAKRRMRDGNETHEHENDASEEPCVKLFVSLFAVILFVLMMYLDILATSPQRLNTDHIDASFLRQKIKEHDVEAKQDETNAERERERERGQWENLPRLLETLAILAHRGYDHFCWIGLTERDYFCDFDRMLGEPRLASADSTTRYWCVNTLSSETLIKHLKDDRGFEITTDVERIPKWAQERREWMCHGNDDKNFGTTLCIFWGEKGTYDAKRMASTNQDL